MAQVSDYGTLKAWIAATGHRGDLTTDIPGFIESAESMIAETVRSTEMVKVGTVLEADRFAGPIYNTPSDFLGARLVIGSQSGQFFPLKPVSLAELYRYGLSGTPVVFSVYDQKIEFRASPAVNAQLGLIYFARPAAFVQDADTNSLLTKHPTLYQHASMFWFHVHTQDVELATAHESAFRDAVIGVNALAEEVRGAGSVANQQHFHSGATM